MLETTSTPAMLTSSHLSIGLGLLGLAILGVLCLGFYIARRAFALHENNMQRILAEVGRQSRTVIGATPTANPGARAEPLPPVPSDLSNDDDWNELNALWVREALEQKQREQERADELQASLRRSQEQQAAKLAALGQLAVPTAEPLAQGAPTAGAP